LVAIWHLPGNEAEETAWSILHILVYFPAHLKTKTFTRGQARAADDDHMKILLIQPPVEDFYQTSLRTLPVGLLYLAAALRCAGIGAARM
jgi:hypothetical protein